MGKSTINHHIFNSYVKLPEGNIIRPWYTSSEWQILSSTALRCGMYCCAVEPHGADYLGFGIWPKILLTLEAEQWKSEM